MNVTADGDYFGQQLPAGTPVLIEATGEFDLGIVTFGFKTPGGVFAPFMDPSNSTVPISSAIGTAFECVVPRSGFVGINLLGSGGSPDIAFFVTPVSEPLQRS